MIRKGLFLVCALLIPALLLAAKPSKSKGKNKKKAKTEQTDTTSAKKTSDYDKLFKGKKCQTVKGLVTIHKVDGEKLARQGHRQSPRPFGQNDVVTLGKAPGAVGKHFGFDRAAVKFGGKVGRALPSAGFRPVVAGAERSGKRIPPSGPYRLRRGNPFRSGARNQPHFE